MLKVLHVVGAYLPDSGGTVQRIRNLALPLVKEGSCEIHVLTSKQGFRGKQKTRASSLLDEEVIEGIQVHRVEHFNHLFCAIRKVSLQHDIDLIHTHNPRFDFFCLATHVRRPIIAEIHTIRSLSLLKFQLAKIVYRRVAKVICLSQKMEQVILREFKLSANKVEVIYNGVNVDRVASEQGKGNVVRNRYHIQEPLIVGYIGTFYQWQGVTDLVKAFSILAKEREDTRLLLVGSGPDLKVVHELVDSLGIERKVTMTGMISSDSIPDYYSAIDVFVIPRPRTIETESALPLKVLEGMAAGKAIVATDVGGLTEVLKDGVNSLLVTPGSPKELADATTQLLDDNGLRLKLGRNARNIVKEGFQWGSSSKRLLASYRSLC